MKKLIAITTVAALVLATPAMAGGWRGGYGHHHSGGHHQGGSNGSLVNLGVSDIGVLNGSQFLNGVNVGNNNSVLSGILSGNTVLNGNSTSVLSGIGLGLFNDNSRTNKRSGRRW